MSKNFSDSLTQKYNNIINQLVASSPSYIGDFAKSMAYGKRKISTQAAYIGDTVQFLTYEANSLSDYRERPLKELPLDVLRHITNKDLEEYRKYLLDEKNLSAAAAKRMLSSVSCFFKFLLRESMVEKNPFDFFELPSVSKSGKIVHLDSDLSKRLLEGILRNDLYLAKTEVGEKPLPIPDKIWLKRERLVLRNYAITCLFLGTGLRVSELVGLDTNDVNFRIGAVTVVTKGGDTEEVFFGEDVARALHMYMDQPTLPQEMVDRYLYTQEEVIHWCKDHANADHFDALLKEEFPDQSDAFYRDMKIMTDSFRRSGRSWLANAKSGNALFLSSRGTRMSVRMVELMIKEMVQTYLPEYEDKDKFSPHKLRATCATRILTQTGNISLAKTQLNHKGIQVTAEYYAAYEKEKSKELLQDLDMYQW